MTISEFLFRAAQRPLTPVALWRPITGRMKSATVAIAVGTLTGLSAFSPGALAVDTIWDAGTGDWFDGANWDTGNAPTSADMAFISNGGTAQIQDPGAEAAFVTVSSSTGTDTLEVSGDGTLASSSGMVVGDLLGESGALVISSGATVDTLDVDLGFAAGSFGEATVTGAGSTWTIDVEFDVGSSGSGRLTIADGGSIEQGDNAYLGDHVGGSGEATVTGSGSSWISHFDMRVGDEGEGVLLIEDGGSVSNDEDGIIARLGSGSSGEVTVTGTGSTWTNGADLIVGDEGQGVLTIADGASVTNIDGYIARFGGTSEATVTGAGSTWANSGDLYIGDGGVGSLIVEDGGEVTATTVTLGNSSGDLDLNGTSGSRGFIETSQITEGSGSGTIDFGGGGVRLTGNQASLFSGFEAGDVTFDTGGGTIDTQSFNVGISMVLDGTGGLTKDGSGTLTLAGVNTFTGGITVEDGILTRSVAGGFVSDTDYTVNGGTLTLNNIALTASSLSGTGGTVGMGSATLTVNQSGNTTYEGAITGTGGLTKQGTGTLSLEGDSTFTGNATVNAGTLEVDGGSFTQGAGDMRVGLSSGDNGTLVIENGGTIANELGRVGEASGSTGAVTVDGTGSLWDNSGTLFVGNSGTGELTISDGGEVESTESRLGDTATGVGEATVTGTGSLWEVAGTLYVGNSGSGTLTVEDEGLVVTDFVRLGNNAGGSVSIEGGGQIQSTNVSVGVNGTGDGEATVTGAGSLWQISSLLIVGNGGNGIFAIEDGGEVFSAAGNLGNGATGVGELSVGGADSFWGMSSSLVVGNSGTGTLTIEDGGTVTNTFSRLGDNAGGSGEVTVTGAGSFWDNASTLYVGSSGTGEMTISDGGEVESTEGRLGDTATGIGEATVTGTDSLWQMSLSLTAGNNGTGTLTIENGGTVENTFSRVGELAGSSGEVTVTGAGSLWSHSSDQYIGNSGSGTLTISDGGSVEITSGRIGDAATGIGEVTVTGTGSLWELSSFLVVGNLGSGTLVIEDGGEVRSVDDAIIAAGATGVGDVTVTGTDSLWQMSDIRVGETGSGTLTVEDGGQVTALSLVVGLDASSSGAVLVDGATLEAAQIERGSGTGTVDFDDAVLILTGNQASLFTGFAAGDITIAAGGLVIDTQTFTATAIGGFDGTGGLTKQGSGILNLDGTGTYSGGTVVEEGTLGVDDGDELGSGTVTLEGATLAFNTVASTLANEIEIGADGGTLLDNGFGDQIVTGDVTLNGDLLLDGANVIRLAGDVSGSGRLTVDMANGAAITGDATHTGGTLISSGILLIGDNGTTGSISGDIENNAVLQFLRTDDVTNDGDISGTGTLIKGSAGTLTLTGALSYTGNTNVGAGTLVLAGDTGGLGGDILDDANLVFDQAADSSFAGDISGVGTLLKTGAGTLTLTGDHSYSGATGVGEGTLVFDGGDSTIGTLTAAGGDLVIRNGAVVSNDAGFIGRTGIGSATATVTGAGSEWQTTGDLQVSEIIPMPLGGTGGTLRVENGAEVNVGGELFLDILGVLEIDGNSQVTAADGMRLKAGTVRLLGDGALNIPDIVIDGVAGIIDTNGFDGSYAGTIATSGTFQVFVKDGAGELVLTGDHTDAELQAYVDAGTLEIGGTFAGDAFVNAGSTLIVNGSLAGPVLVNGTLGGDGSVGGIDSDGGIVAPGNSIGTLTVNGNVDFSDGATYEVELNAAGDSDLIDATGVALLTGGDLLLIAEEGDYESLTTYLILTADGGIDGEFDSVDSDFTFLTPQLAYDANNVFLNLVRSDVEFLDVAGTWNQRQVAQELDAIGATPGGDFQALMNALLTLTPEEARAAFDALSGVQHTHGLHVARQALRGLQRLSFGRLGGGGRNPGLSGLTLAFSDQSWAQQMESHWLSMLDGAGDLVQERGLWVRGYGVWGDIDSDANAAGSDYDTGGLAFGLDAEFGEHWVAGVAGGYAATDTDSIDTGLDTDTFQVAGYAGFEHDRWYAQGLVGHAWHDTESTRLVSFTGFASTSEADYDTTTFSAAMEAGYDFALREETTITPFVAFDYARSHRDSYTESGLAGLAVDGETAHSLRPTLGLRLSHTLTADNGAKFEPVLYAAYAREVLDNVSRVQGTFAAAAADGFIIDGPETDRDRVLVGAAMNTALTQRANLTLAWDAELADSDTAHALSVTFRYRW